MPNTRNGLRIGKVRGIVNRGKIEFELTDCGQDIQLVDPMVDIRLPYAEVRCSLEDWRGGRDACPRRRT